MRIRRNQSASKECEVDLGFRGEHSHDKRAGRHFKGEDGDLLAIIDGGVAADIERERRLAHGGSRGQNKKIPWLQSTGHLI